jgi:hypothetical protein
MQEKSVPAALLNRLRVGMRAALTESSDVLHVVEEIEAHGFKVMLVVDAIIQPMEQALWSTTPSNPVSSAKT